MPARPPRSLEALITAALERAPAGGGWLAALLDAAPDGRPALGELVDQPGWIDTPLSVRGVSGRPACFEQRVAPARDLLAWLIDHPDRLTAPDPGADARERLVPETERLRRVLLDDDPPGARARAQARAHELLATSSPYPPAWWRFEEPARPQCVLATARLVLTVQSDELDPLTPATPWYPSRARLVRELEAARRLAGEERRYASLLIADDPLPASVDELVASGTPHLDASARAELRQAFLGVISWDQASRALSA